MTKNRIQILVLCAIAVVIDVVLGQAVSMLKIPLLFLDTIGIIFIAAEFGMAWGVLTGVVSNLVMVVSGSGPSDLPFMLIDIAIAIVVALFAKGKGFTVVKSIICGIVLGFVCSVMGTLIRIAFFGGLTGSGTDLVILGLKAAGQNLFSSVFLGTLGANMVDKIVSCFLVAWLMKLPVIKKAMATFAGRDYVANVREGQV
jgi:energy-coupling factor transport system substrate-specific component